MQFRIPLSLKEYVTVVRFSAYTRGEMSVIASDVACMVMPGRDLVSLEDGVPIRQSDLRSDWTVLLERPNGDISEGDVLRRADGSELQVYGVRRLGNVMFLEINNVAIP